MRRPKRLLALALQAGLLLGAGAASAAHPLDFAPADTAYVFGTLEPVDAEVAAAWIARDARLPGLYAPMLRQMLAQSPQGADKQGRALLKALDRELEGRSLAELMQRWGLSTQPLAALYGLGPLPVLRLELEDTTRFREALLRFAGSAALKLQRTEFEGLELFQLPPADAEPEGDGPRTELLLALHGQHLVLALLPQASDEALRRKVLGLDRPAQSVLSSGRLQALNQRFALLPQASGEVDFARLVELLQGEAEGVHAEVLAAMQFEPVALDAGCKPIADGLVESWPRLAFGYTDLSADGYQQRFVLENDPALRARLEGLQGPRLLPADPAHAGGELSLSLRADALRELLGSWPGDGADACPLALMAALQLGKLREPLLNPQVFLASRHFQSAQLRLEPLGEDPAENWQGSLVLHSLKPEAALEAFAADLPAGSETPRMNGPAARIAMEPGQLPVFALARSNLLALARGEAVAEQLPARLDQAEPEPLIAELILSGALLRTLMDTGLAQMGDEARTPEVDTALGPMREQLDALQRLRYRLQVREHGLELIGDVRFRR
jgi:hypothetical protein